MKKTLRHLAALSALAIICTNVSAQSPSTGQDYSDLWFNATESGWGMNVVHQDKILFITLFIYGEDRKPTWFVASNVAYVSTNAGGDHIFRGDLFQTTGTPFNVVPFVAGSIGVTTVGSISFTGLAAGSANVTYTVNGVTNGTVNKTAARQTWRPNTVSATEYVGATSYTRNNCTNATLNGYQSDAAKYTLTITDNTLKIVEDNGPGKVCNWNGNYTQVGRFGRSSGTIVCEDGVPGTYNFTDLQISPHGFGASYTVRSPACAAAGQIGGVRK